MNGCEPANPTAQAQVDLRALEQAAHAVARLDAHERTCGERYAEARDSTQRLHSRIDKVDGKLWAIVLGVAAAVLVGVLNFLLESAGGG